MSWKIDVITRQKEVEKIIRDYWIVVGEFTVTDDGIDVNGSVKFPSASSFITELPLKFNKVSGDFDCSRMNLTSLKGSPIEVGGIFDCSYNQLTSLEFAPKKARRFVFDNMVKSIYTGDRSCDYNEVELFFRTNDPKLMGLSKILTENAHFLPIVFKYQPYYSWDDGKLNENQMDELIEDIMDGLE